MKISSLQCSCGAVSLETATELIQQRIPRAAARSEVAVKSVPIRTCYETLTRLSGPSDAVLDYAAALFADDAANPARPSPPLALEEAHVQGDGETLSLLLSRGMYSPAA